jgi:hypothetical protein
MYRRAIALLTGVILISLLAACGEASPTTASSAASTPAPASTTAAASSTTAAATLPPGAKTVKASATSKEYTSLKSVVPTITNTLDALKKGDVAGAKKAFEEYSYAWNGVEAYVKARSPELYGKIEVENEFKATDLFEKGTAKPEEIIPYVEGVQKGFDEALKMAESGPDYNALLDEIADLRILRVNLLRAGDALKANDPVPAIAALQNFKAGWPAVEQIISSRDKASAQDIQDKLGKVENSVLNSAKPSVADATAAVEALRTSYNNGLKLLTDALSGK